MQRPVLLDTAEQVQQVIDTPEGHLPLPPKEKEAADRHSQQAFGNGLSFSRAG